MSSNVDDEQLREFIRQWNAHQVHVDVNIEIPREAWAWAVAHAGIDTPSDRIEDLPDPNDLPDTAGDLVDAHYHYEVVPENEGGRTDHQRVVYEVVEEHGEIRPRELYEKYEERVGNPRSERQVRNYLRNLEEERIVEAVGQTHNRSYRARSETRGRER